MKKEIAMDTPKTNNKFLEAAIRYFEKHGFSVIPVRPDKTPFVKWEEYQRRLPTLEEIKAWWEQWPHAMIGIVTGRLSDVCAIDVDTDEGKEAIQEYIPDSLLMPTVQTPGGGQHMYFKPPENCPSNNSKLIIGCDFRGEGGYIIAPPSVNDADKVYSWLDSLSIDEVALPPLPSAYIAFINDFAFKGYKEDAVNNYAKLRKATENYESYFQLGQRDETIFHIATCLIRGRMEEGLARKALSMLASQCNPPFDEKDAQAKIDSALKRIERKQRPLAEEIREWVKTTQGYFLTTDIHAELRITTPEDKKACYSTLLRMCESGEIEKHGDKRGCFRVVDNSCEEIDFLNITGVPLDIRLPFAVESLVKVLPKNIIVIAGEPNAGKTAYLLNVAEMNMERYEVWYFSSEMGALELQDRLQKFDKPLKSWKVNFRERSSNFADVIRPDAINIIDFLEVHDEFYKVGLYIKEIYDKLNKGIAIIAIQKNKGADYGLGGGRGLEKARLYLSMEPGKIRIVKGKNWASQENPNGLEIQFKLIAGCRFKEEAFWKKAN